MSRISDFLKKYKIPFLWTCFYIFATWALMHILFNFEIFNSAHWHRVAHAHLHGLGGFAFCLIIFACIPLYIATTTIVLRTGKPLLALPMPKFIAKIIEKLFPKQTTQSDEQPEPETESVVDTHDASLDNIPAEMHAVFLRARTRPNRTATPICSVCSVTPNVYPATPSDPNTTHSDMPLPPDFDFDDAPLAPTAPTSVPMFQDIDLGFDNTPDPDDETNPVIDYLSQNGRKFDITDDDIIITDTAAIAVHNDNDFWIMDEPIWFAAGKTRPSPIEHLLATAAEHNVRAILYLGATNIMNCDEKIAQWEQSGIHVVKKLTDL